MLIPHGRVASYGLIADLAGLPGRARQVGRAMRIAPNSLDLPWYRILRADGKIAFPVGSDSAMRQIALLREESIDVCRHRVDMKRFGWRPDLGELLIMQY